MDKTRRRFTLIELLVVVAVIGILVAMLLPALSKAKERAKLVLCLNNMKQMGSAIVMYTGDWNNVLPYTDVYQDLVGWEAKGGQKPRPLNKYVEANSRDGGVAKCPGDKGTNLRSVGQTHFDKFGSSYIVQLISGWNVARWTNDLSTSNGGGGPTSYRNRITQYEFPSYKVTFHSTPLRGDRPWDNVRNRWHNQSRSTYPFAYMDGHAESTLIWWKERMLKAPSTHADGREIDRDGYY